MTGGFALSDLAGASDLLTALDLCPDVVQAFTCRGGGGSRAQSGGIGTSSRGCAARGWSRASGSAFPDAAPRAGSAEVRGVRRAIARQAQGRPAAQTTWQAASRHPHATPVGPTRPALHRTAAAHHGAQADAGCAGQKGTTGRSRHTVCCKKGAPPATVFGPSHCTRHLANAAVSVQSSAALHSASPPVRSLAGGPGTRKLTRPLQNKRSASASSQWRGGPRHSLCTLHRDQPERIRPPSTPAEARPTRSAETALTPPAQSDDIGRGEAVRGGAYTRRTVRANAVTQPILVDEDVSLRGTQTAARSTAQAQPPGAHADTPRTGPQAPREEA